MTRRLLSLALILSVAAAACGDSAPESLSGVAAGIYSGDCADGTGTDVVIYSGRTENLISPVLEAFECETGVNVEVQWGS